MSGDVAGYLTTGELARCAAVTVRTVRWYSDQGLLSPCCRSAAGYRLYDSETLARLELIRTLREIGPDLPVIKKVLAREVNLADVAAAHADALESRIRTLWLRHAVLRAVPPPRFPARLPRATASRWPASVQAEAVGDRSGFHPAGGAQLGKDAGDVDAGGLGADEQCLGDLAVAAPGRDQREHLGLALGQAQLRGGRRSVGRRGGGVLGKVEAGTPGQGLYLGVEQAGAQPAGDGGGASQDLGCGVAVAGAGQQRLGLAETGVGGPVGLAEPLPRRRRGRPGRGVGRARLPRPLGSPLGVPAGHFWDAGGDRAGCGLAEPLEQRGCGAVVGGGLAGAAGPGQL